MELDRQTFELLLDHFWVLLREQCIARNIFPGEILNTHRRSDDAVRAREALFRRLQETIGYADTIGKREWFFVSEGPLPAGFLPLSTTIIAEFFGGCHATVVRANKRVRGKVLLRKDDA